MATKTRRRTNEPSFDTFWEQLYGTDKDPTTGLWWRMQDETWHGAGMVCLEQRERRSARLHECIQCGSVENVHAVKSILIPAVKEYFMCAECDA